jgi:hypothetical protein
MITLHYCLTIVSAVGSVMGLITLESVRELTDVMRDSRREIVGAESRLGLAGQVTLAGGAGDEDEDERDEVEDVSSFPWCYMIDNRWRRRVKDLDLGVGVEGRWWKELC